MDRPMTVKTDVCILTGFVFFFFLFILFSGGWQTAKWCIIATNWCVVSRDNCLLSPVPPCASHFFYFPLYFIKPSPLPLFLSLPLPPFFYFVPYSTLDCCPTNTDFHIHNGLFAASFAVLSAIIISLNSMMRWYPYEVDHKPHHSNSI